MAKRSLANRLQGLSTAILCNASPAVRAMRSALVPLSLGYTIVGPARTVRISPGQNAAIHRSVHKAQRGDVLVVDGGGNTSYGPFGDILATCCQHKGIRGAVIDSTIRDLAEIREMRFPVFCLGGHPAPTEKSDPGKIDISIICGGVEVEPGDIVVGDEDGVVVVPRNSLDEVVRNASAILDQEKQIQLRLSNGETTCEIFGIDYLQT